MNFEISHHHHYALIKARVEKLDANHAVELKSELVLINKKGVNSIVLDLSQVKYCDSSGLSAVLVANRLCKDSSGKFVLCGLTPAVKKLIEISQLDRVLNIVEDLQEATTAID